MVGKSQQFFAKLETTRGRVEPKEGQKPMRGPIVRRIAFLLAAATGLAAHTDRALADTGPLDEFDGIVDRARYQQQRHDRQRRGMANIMARMTSVAVQIRRATAQLRRLAWVAALLLAASPAAAQVVTSNGGQLQINTPGGQQLSATQTSRSATQNSRSAPSQAPATGTFCIDEMTATFCNVPTGPNNNGYGSSGGSTSGGGSMSGGTSASGSGSTSAGTGVNTSSLPPCMREPLADELCD
jgi:hypothetical protein